MDRNPSKVEDDRRLRIRIRYFASDLITWVMRDESHPQADLAFTWPRAGSAVVPAISWYEARSILIVNERRGRVTPTATAIFLNQIASLRIETDPVPDELLSLDLSRRAGLTVYDAAYLALAMREHIPLATLDKVLQAVAVDEGVALLA